MIDGCEARRQGFGMFGEDGYWDSKLGMFVKFGKGKYGKGKYGKGKYGRGKYGKGKYGRNGKMGRFGKYGKYGKYGRNGKRGKKGKNHRIKRTQSSIDGSKYSRHKATSMSFFPHRSSRLASHLHSSRHKSTSISDHNIQSTVHNRFRTSNNLLESKMDRPTLIQLHGKSRASFTKSLHSFDNIRPSAKPKRRSTIDSTHVNFRKSSNSAKQIKPSQASSVTINRSNEDDGQDLPKPIEQLPKTSVALSRSNQDIQDLRTTNLLIRTLSGNFVPIPVGCKLLTLTDHILCVTSESQFQQMDSNQTSWEKLHKRIEDGRTRVPLDKHSSMYLVGVNKICDC